MAVRTRVSATSANKRRRESRNRGSLAGVGIAMVIIVIAIVGILILAELVELHFKQQEAQKEIATLDSVITELQNSNIPPSQYTPGLIEQVGGLPKSDIATVNGQKVLKNPFGGQVQVEPESSYKTSTTP